MSSRAVVDTCVLIEAGSKWVDVLSEIHKIDNSARLLLKKIIKEHKGLYSSEIFEEYIRKLNENGHPNERIIILIGLLMKNFEFVSITSSKYEPEPTDKDDVRFMLCAFDGNADLLISQDKHLLDLKSKCRDFDILDIAEAYSVL